MDVIALRSIVTVVLFAVFIGIVWWSWSARNKARFQSAEQLPFDDEELHHASKLGAQAGKNSKHSKVQA
jgi:cytochrome c oxidase cbb3-type subunit IV